jgi:hypothetical protein
MFNIQCPFGLLITCFDPIVIFGFANTHTSLYFLVLYVEVVLCYIWIMCIMELQRGVI